MAHELPGLHHCIGTARAVTDIVFRSLRAECAASGGSLSLKEVEALHSRIVGSFSSGLDLFELGHHRCMGASLSLANMPFERDKILATLLRACGEKSACAAFSPSVERLGEDWINDLFDSLAQYVRERVRTNIDIRLVDAYVDTATIPLIKLTIDELLNQGSIQRALLECVTVFEAPGGPEALAKDVCDYVNKYIADRRGIGGPHVCKVTESETQRFLTLLPPQIRATIGLITETVAELSISPG